MTRGAALLVLSAVAGCSSKPREDHAAITAIASNSMAIRAPSEPASASAAPLLVKLGTRRPIDESDVLLLPGRRTRLEALAPESKGFLTSAELEEKLYSLNLRRGVDADALRAFDGMVKGSLDPVHGQHRRSLEGRLRAPHSVHAERRQGSARAHEHVVRRQVHEREGLRHGRIPAGRARGHPGALRRRQSSQEWVRRGPATPMVRLKATLVQPWSGRAKKQAKDMCVSIGERKLHELYVSCAAQTIGTER